MTKTPVPRIGRILDLVGFVLLFAGGAVTARAWLGFQHVRHYQPHAGDLPWAAIRLANHYLRLQRIGVAVMLAGICVFVLAWGVARGASSRLRSGPQEKEGVSPTR